VNLIFKSRDQLLDPDDPSPPSHQELTQVAEDSIIENMNAVSLKKPVILEIQLPGLPDHDPSSEISEAIRHHFRFVLTEHERETGIFIRDRRLALIFTGINLLIALVYVVFLYSNESFITTIPGIVIGAIIVIINWATIWDTYEFFIFDGLEKGHRKKLLNKIIHGEIRVIPPGKNG
jgi:hypothetical protein